MSITFIIQYNLNSIYTRIAVFEPTSIIDRDIFTKYFIDIFTGKNVEFLPPRQDLYKTGPSCSAAKLQQPNPYALRQLHANQDLKIGNSDKLSTSFANKITPNINRNSEPSINTSCLRANQIVKTGNNDKLAPCSFGNKTTAQFNRTDGKKLTEANSGKYEDVLESLEISDIDFTEDVFAEINPNETKTKEISPNLFSSGENMQMKLSKVDKLGFSQFCRETGVMKQIDNLISPIKLPQTNKVNTLTPPASQSKRKSLEDHTDAKPKRNSLEGPKDVVALDYRLGISQLFEDLERSICEPGPNQDQNLLLDPAVLNQKHTGFNTRVFPAENTEKIKILENITLPNVNKWLEDSFMNDSKAFSQTQDEIQKVLMENACKNIDRQVVMNRTLVTSQVKLRELGPFYGLPNKVMELIRSYKGINELYGE